MSTVTRGIRVGLVAALIPVTLFSGRPTAGCVCADGHIKLVCPNHGGCCGASHNVGGQTAGFHSCCCHSTDAQHDGSHSSCCQHRQCPNSPAAQSSDKAGCRGLSLDPTVVTAKVKIPAIQMPVIAHISHEDWARFPFGAVETVRWTWLEPGPPQSLFIKLQRLLI